MTTDLTPWWHERPDVMAHLWACIIHSKDFRHPDCIFAVGWGKLTPQQHDKLVILRLKIQAGIISDNPDTERVAYCVPD